MLCQVILQDVKTQKSIHLGYFDKKIDAAKARYEAEIKHNWFNCESGDSSAKRYINNYNKKEMQYE